ncbi:NAD(P)H-quinone oxidoreductase [Micrococcales bacterium 31B]|nr:NAD(P)H-quinone oxidoreductase [Micrococcales bacterium 31B]
MQAVTVTAPIDALDLAPGEAPAPPAPGPDEVLIDIAYSALNRADIAQRAGAYPPPPGASNILGLEAAGVVREVGSAVTEFAVGDRVAALLVAGGYAEQVTVPAAQCFSVPDDLPLERAAALPETLCTVTSNVFMLAGLTAGQRLLVHGGAGGIGITAIQLARAEGCEAYATVGSDEKAAVIRSLGATAINYRTDDFVTALREAGGVDVVLDCIGGPYLNGNVKSLRRGGHLVIIGLQQGRHGELDLGTLMMKRLSVHGTTLRSRPLAEKAEICQVVRERFWPLYASGRLSPRIDTVVPLSQVGEAHARMEDSAHVGKIVLQISAG